MMAKPDQIKPDPDRAASVLIVEPSLELAVAWGRQLRAQGLEVLIASNQDDAVDLLESRSFDALVLDLILDEGDSPLAVLDVAGYRYPNIKVVVINRGGFFSDGSIFELAPNLCVALQPHVPPEDLATIVAFYARRAHAVSRPWGAQ